MPCEEWMFNGSSEPVRRNVVQGFGFLDLVVSGYACEGNVVGAVVLFNEMRKEVVPNVVTMIVMMQLVSMWF